MKLGHINKYLSYILYTSFIFLIGLWIGSNFFYDNPKLVFRQLSSNKIHDVINYIENYYLDSVDLNKASDQVIKTLVSSLDPHSQYFPSDYFDNSRAALQGNFEGIGIEFNIFNDTVVVINVIVGGPSQKAGILPGDKIIKVEEEAFVGKSINSLKVVKTLRGKKGSKVTIKVIRQNQQKPIPFTITRDKIPIKTIETSYLSNRQVGYIKITRFGAKTYLEFRVAITNFINQDIDKVVIDVRGNGGGYLGSVVKIAGEFLKKNTLVVYTDGKKDYFDEVYKTNKEGLFKGDVIILIDEYSASASEILAGALQDNDRALLIGRRSFGKGLVQRAFKFQDGAQLNLTISRYYTPSGRCIQKPYNDHENYSNDLLDRFKTGEFFVKDSINVDSSTIFHTKNGRKVYSKGGIMPDYFMAIDTTHYSPLLRTIIQKNILNEFSFEWANKYRNRLNNMNLKDFQEDKAFENLMLGDFIGFLKQHDLNIQLNDFQKNVSYSYILRFMKGLVARQFWEQESYYTFTLLEDKVVNKAIMLFPSIKTILTSD